MAFVIVVAVLLSVHASPSTGIVGTGQGNGLPPLTQQFNGTNITDLITPRVSYRFIQSSQNIEENRLNSLSDLYFYLSIQASTGNLGSLSTNETDALISRVRSFQNADGGFGDWYRDRSKAGSTRRALEVLGLLGSSPANSTAVETFLARLQVSGLDYGNYGFRSTVKESDADITSTYNVVKALYLLNATIPNRTGVVDYLKDHQNEDGGFGYQTNRESGVIWPSTMVHSFRGVQALYILGEDPVFETRAADYIIGLQGTPGGFSNTEGSTESISYTYDALIALDMLGEPFPRPDDIESFVKGNQLPSGGFIEHALDDKEGIHTTYYAIEVLGFIGAAYNAQEVVDFAERHLNDRLDGGFGEYPGISSTMRVTFDAVSALNLIGRSPRDPQAVLDFVEGFRNADGGYGEHNSSNVETTYRALLTIRLLGAPVVDPGGMTTFLRTCQNNDGGFGFSHGYVSRGAYTYRAIRALEILGLRPLNVGGAVSYLRSLQNEDGGFGNYFDEGDSDMGSTYRVVRGLAILGSSPSKIERTEEFILGSQNPDGGFRRSPEDTTAPNNFSRSYYTYDSVLALHFLGSPLGDPGPVYDYVVRLRNPDLGFATNPFFTSEVSSTFTSLWTLYYLVEEFNDAPALTSWNLTLPPPNSTEPATFTLRYSDADGQYPEYVHLDLDGSRTSMQLNGSEGNHSIYTTNVNLAVGDHVYHFFATDGLKDIETTPGTATVIEVGSAPYLNLTTDQIEGTSETLFMFRITYFDPDQEPPVFVRISISDGPWIDVSGVGGTYVYQTKLNPGIQSVRSWTSDGINHVLSEEITLVVHTESASRPDWTTFLAIRETILEHTGVEIAFEDIELTTHKEELAWSVSVDGSEYLVSYDGTEIVSGEENGNGNMTPYIAAAILIAVIAGSALFIWKKDH